MNSRMTNFSGGQPRARLYQTKTVKYVINHYTHMYYDFNTKYKIGVYFHYMLFDFMRYKHVKAKTIELVNSGNHTN